MLHELRNLEFIIAVYDDSNVCMLIIAACQRKGNAFSHVCLSVILLPLVTTAHGAIDQLCGDPQNMLKLAYFWTSPDPGPVHPLPTCGHPVHFQTFHFGKRAISLQLKCLLAYVAAANSLIRNDHGPEAVTGRAQ